MNTHRRIINNTIIQTAGRVLGLALATVSVYFIANHLSVNNSVLTGYGQYAIVVTYISIIGAAADLGLFTWTVRELSGKVDQNEAGELIGNALIFRFALLILALIILSLVLPFLPYAHVVKIGVVLGALIAFCMLFSQAIAALFQAAMRPVLIVVAELSGSILFTGLVIYLLLHGYGLIPVVLANLAGNILTLILSLILSRKITKIKLKLNFTMWRQAAVDFSSIALVTILVLIHFRVDSLILSLYQSPADVSLYSVAYKILDVTLVIPSIIAANLLPSITRMIANRTKEAVAQVIPRLTGGILMVALSISAGVFILAPWLIAFITGPQFIGAVLPLRILVPAIVFFFMTTFFTSVIIAMKKQSTLVKGYLVVVIFDIAINLLLAPRLSYIGSGIATTVSELFVLFYTFYLLSAFGYLKSNSKLVLQLLVFAVVLFIFGAVQHSTIMNLRDFEALNKAGQFGYLLIAMAILVASSIVSFWVAMGFSAKRMGDFLRLPADEQ